MTLFLLSGAALAALTLLILTRPLWRPRDSRGPAAADPVARWREQIVQLDALRAAGALGEQAHAEARAALEKQIVEHVVSAPAAAASAPAARRPRRLLGALAALCGVVLVGGYAWLGAPAALDGDAPGAPAPAAGMAAPAGSAAANEAAAQAPHELGQAQMAGMTERLAERLKKQPDDGAGWAMLARSYAVLGRHEQAVPAFRKAQALQPDDAMLLVDFADALAMTQQRRLDGEPMRLVRRALEIQPDNPKALSLAGTEAFDRRDYAAALKHWERLRTVAPADSPLVRQVQSGIDEARALAGLPPAPGASAAVAAATDKAAAAGGSAAVAAKAGSAVSGLVTLAPALRAKAAPTDTVFVFARAAQGPRMPLAITRHQVKDLPLRFTLDDRDAMSPDARLSRYPSVVVGARISKDGQALAQPGDLQGQSAAVALGSADVRIEINQAVAR